MTRFLIFILERIPLTPWWWNRRRTVQRQMWIRHINRYHSDIE